MALKLLIFFIIAYWIVRAAINLWRAAASDPRAVESGRDRIRDEEIRREVNGKHYEQTWAVGQKPKSPRRTEAVEDARWRDV